MCYILSVGMYQSAENVQLLLVQLLLVSGTAFIGVWYSFYWCLVQLLLVSGTAFTGTAFTGTAFTGTAFTGTAFTGTAFTGTAFIGVWYSFYWYSLHSADLLLQVQLSYQSQCVTTNRGLLPKLCTTTTTRATSYP